MTEKYLPEAAMKTLLGNLQSSVEELKEIMEKVELLERATLERELKEQFIGQVYGSCLDMKYITNIFITAGFVQIVAKHLCLSKDSKNCHISLNKDSVFTFATKEEFFDKVSNKIPRETFDTLWGSLYNNVEENIEFIVENYNIAGERIN